MSDPVTVDLQLARGDKGLRISYTVHNRSAEKIYVLDQMVVVRGAAYLPQPQAMIVRRGAKPGTVELVRGYVDPGHPVAHPYPPAARSLEPGKSLEGSAEVALPLSAQHPYGRLLPLGEAPRTATLQIGYLGASQKSEWTSYPLADGGQLTAPTLPSVVQQQRFATSAPRPIP